MNIVEKYRYLEKYDYIYCPKCNFEASTKKWDETTDKDFEGHIITFKECIKNIEEQSKNDNYYAFFHTCPHCNRCSTTLEILNANQR